MLICHHHKNIQQQPFRWWRWKPVVDQQLSGKQKSLSKKVPDLSLNGENNLQKCKAGLASDVASLTTDLATPWKISGFSESGLDFSRAEKS